jgi:hypothetical protein
MYKFKKLYFSNKIIFTKAQKSHTSLERLDKISIFEYFGIVEERKTGRKGQILIKEIIDYMTTQTFTNEFKYSISNDTKKHKFLFLNFWLLGNRLTNEKVKITNFENYLEVKLLTFLFKYSPLFLFCKDVIRYYIRQEQIAKLYNYIIENEMMKQFNKLDFQSLKTRREFIKDLNKLEQNDENSNDDQIIKKIENKYIREYMGIENQFEVDKITTYILAHVKFT